MKNFNFKALLLVSAMLAIILLYNCEKIEEKEKEETPSANCTCPYLQEITYKIIPYYPASNPFIFAPNESRDTLIMFNSNEELQALCHTTPPEFDFTNSTIFYTGVTFNYAIIDIDADLHKDIFGVIGKEYLLEVHALQDGWHGTSGIAHRFWQSNVKIPSDTCIKVLFRHYRPD